MADWRRESRSSRDRRPSAARDWLPRGGASLAVLRDDATQEALQVRTSLAETRQAMVLYDSTKNVFGNIKGVIKGLVS